MGSCDSFPGAGWQRDGTFGSTVRGYGHTPRAESAYGPSA